MLVNPKKLKDLEIDKDNATMVAVNKGNRNGSWPNVALILFKHLEKKEDIINLFYSLTHSDSTYSDDYANMIVNKMSQTIKQFFVTYANDTKVFNWNQDSGLYALVLDPTYTAKTDTKSFNKWYSLTVGGFNPNRGVTFTFRNQQIRWTEIMTSNSWKLQWYDQNVKTSASRINVNKLATTIKFMLGENKAKNNYSYTKVVPTTTTPTSQPANTPVADGARS